MDTQGLSPFHHENFDWTTLTDPNKKAEQVGGVWYKKGTGWGEEEGDMLSRFSLYKDMKQVSSREWVATGQEYVCTQLPDERHLPYVAIGRKRLLRRNHQRVCELAGLRRGAALSLTT